MARSRNIESVKEDIIREVDGIGSRKIQKMSNYEIYELAKKNDIDIKVPDKKSNNFKYIVLSPKFREIEERDGGAVVFHRRKRVVVPYGRRVRVPEEVFKTLCREKRRVKSRKGNKKFVLANRFDVEDVTKKMNMPTVENESLDELDEESAENTEE